MHWHVVVTSYHLMNTSSMVVTDTPKLLTPSDVMFSSRSTNSASKRGLSSYGSTKQTSALTTLYVTKHSRVKQTSALTTL